MKQLTCGSVLPSQYRIPLASSQFFRIGLSFDPPKVPVKRLWLSKPLGAALVIWSFLLIQIILLLNSGNNRLIVIIFGDFSTMMGFGFYYKIGGSIWTVMNISVQLIYYYNHSKGIKPTFLAVFDMLSGLISPESIGLTDKLTLKKLCQRSKTLFSITYFSTTRMTPLIGLLCVYPYYLKTSLWETMMFGVPNAIFLGWVTFTNYGIALWQLFYFYILCYYLNIKIQSINTQLIVRRNRKFRTLRAMNAIHQEIHEYNVTYWSKYLFSIWMLLGSVIVMGIYGIFFVPLDIITRILMVYVISFMVVIMTFIAYTASAVNFEANKFYKSNNLLMANRRIKDTKVKIKVYNIINIIDV